IGDALHFRSLLVANPINLGCDRSATPLDWQRRLTMQTTNFGPAEYLTSPEAPAAAGPSPQRGGKGRKGSS
ncbi:MAG: hypothetical protein OXI66_08480, partial [Boseongicola sp.]|nr:hypothetical protein [Boseongicola sp.]